MWTNQKSLLHRPTRIHFISELATHTGRAVRSCKVPIPIDHEESTGELFGERITHISAPHQIRCEVCSPGSRVIEIVFRIQRIVANKAGEDSGLQCQPLAHRREIRHIRWSKLSEEFVSSDVWSCSGKSKKFGILACVYGCFDTPA